MSTPVRNTITTVLFRDIQQHSGERMLMESLEYHFLNLSQLV